jgi:hypothetical protein
MLWLANNDLTLVVLTPIGNEDREDSHLFVRISKVLNDFLPPSEEYVPLFGLGR